MSDDTRLETFIAANKTKIEDLIESGDLIERRNLASVETTHYVRHLFDGLYVKSAIRIQHDPDFQAWLDKVPA